MADAKSTFKEIVSKGVLDFFAEKGLEMESGLLEKLVVQNAPNPEMGDLGCPMFIFAKANLMKLKNVIKKYHIRY